MPKPRDCRHPLVYCVGWWWVGDGSGRGSGRGSGGMDARPSLGNIGSSAPWGGGRRSHVLGDNQKLQCPSVCTGECVGRNHVAVSVWAGCAMPLIPAQAMISRAKGKSEKEGQGGGEKRREGKVQVDFESVSLQEGANGLLSRTQRQLTPREVRRKPQSQGPGQSERDKMALWG